MARELIIGTDAAIVCATSANSTIWHATSSNGRGWALDNAALVSDPTANLTQPAWIVSGGTIRIIYRALAPGMTVGGGPLMSGTLRF